MIPLATNLDDYDFDRLLALARSRLPALAPQWTDYNYHDPGIMLIELLAWVGDAQIYALARNRTDERLAMAALFGIGPRGALPARGTLYTTAPPARPARLAAWTRVVAVRARAPRVETLATITLLPVTLAAVVRHGGGPPLDLTRINARPRAGCAPFGDSPGEGAELRLRFAAGDDSALDSPALLSLGFQLARADGAIAPGLGAIDAYLDGRPLRCGFDSSRSMQRSGAMVLALPAGTRLNGMEIALRPRHPAVVMPTLLSVAANAIPVAQRASFRIDDRRGTGRAAQRIEIDPRAGFAPDEVSEGCVWRLADRPRRSLQVRISEGQAFELWRHGDLAEAGPRDRVYALHERSDGTAIAILFGNGVNGARPALLETIQIDLRLSCGSRGNVAGSVEWIADGVRLAAVNPQPLTAGRDAEGIDAALTKVRATLRESRMLATGEQIRHAVEALPPALDVARVEVEEGWERGRRRPATAATRTLIVARGVASGQTPAWRRAIRRALSPRISLGERLLVESPVYRRLTVRAEVDVMPGRRPEQVVAAIDAELRGRFAVTGRARPLWPLGRDVDATAVAGWIKAIEGVESVRSTALVDESGHAQDRMRIGRGELPLFQGFERAGGPPPP